MVLIRVLVLHCLIHNVRVYGKHVASSENEIADSLSRFQDSRFLNLIKDKDMEDMPTEIDDRIWPPEKIWIN